MVLGPLAATINVGRANARDGTSADALDFLWPASGYNM
jgi:hypothetical protein